MIYIYLPLGQAGSSVHDVLQILRSSSNLCNAFANDDSRIESASLFSLLLTPPLLLLLLCGNADEQASGVGLGNGSRKELPRFCMEIVSSSALQLNVGDGLGADHQSILGAEVMIGTGEQAVLGCREQSRLLFPLSKPLMNIKYH